MGVKSYNVMDFKPHNGSSGHAFWFNGLYNDGLASDKHFVFDEPGHFTLNNDGTALFTGSIVNVDAADETWDVNIKFKPLGGIPSNLKGAGHAPKISGNTNSQNAIAAWDFFDFYEGEATLSADSGAYAGSTLQLARNNTKYGVQFGEGANDKNKHLGLSSWFHASGDLWYDKDGDGKQEFFDIKKSYGDINVKMEPKPVPEPMSLLGLGAAGVGLVSLKRKKQQNSAG